VHRVAYYVPTIPNVWSTDRYQHALALTETATHSLLIANNPLPEPLQADADASVVLTAEGTVAKAREAARQACDWLTDTGIYVTSYHYEAALSGFLADQRGIRWVPDVYETPAQYRLNQPRTYHQLTSRGLECVLAQANRVVHSFHPSTPFQYGSDRKFLTNGSPVSRIDPIYPTEEPLQMVWVGSPRLDRGGEILVRALASTSAEYDVHIYGETDQGVVDLASELDVDDLLTFHGWVDHEEALDAIRAATIGYAVLPPRTDWRYAPAIKIGEYLAGGTIPLVSAFPGSRYVAAEAGQYVDPRWDSVASNLTEIAALSVTARRDRMEAARQRGEEIPWEQIRTRFAQAVVR